MMYRVFIYSYDSDEVLQEYNYTPSEGDNDPYNAAYLHGCMESDMHACATYVNVKEVD